MRSAVDIVAILAFIVSGCVVRTAIVLGLCGDFSISRLDTHDSLSQWLLRLLDPVTDSFIPISADWELPAPYVLTSPCSGLCHRRVTELSALAANQSPDHLVVKGGNWLKIIAFIPISGCGSVYSLAAVIAVFWGRSFLFLLVYLLRRFDAARVD